MAGRIALVGGDEFRAGCEPIDLAILEASGAKPASILVVPTAAAGQSPAKAASNGVAYFSNLGATAASLMVLDRSDADNAEFVAPVDTANVIYFTGGNPAHLLDVLDGSVLLSRLQQALDRGAVVAGSSAGAMVMGSWMRFREWREALGIVPGVTALPHHERSDPEETSKQLQSQVPSNITVLGIDARTGCLGRPGSWRVVGSGKVTMYQGDKWARFDAGEGLPLEL